MRLKALSVGLAAILAVGCTEQATAPTAPNDAAVAPTFNFINGPDMPGNSGIIRAEGQDFLFGTDPARGLFSVIGLGVPLNESFFCGVDSFDDIDFLSFQEFFAAGARHQHIQGRDVTIEVATFDWNCGDLSIGFGSGNLDVTDNDQFVSGTRANAFGWSAHGKLIDNVTGETLNYSETQRAVELKDGTLRWLVENIKVH